MEHSYLQLKKEVPRWQTKKSREVIGLIKFHGDKDKWHEWSVKAFALAKTKGFRHVYAADTKPCSDADCTTTSNNKIKEIKKRTTRHSNS